MILTKKLKDFIVSWRDLHLRQQPCMLLIYNKNVWNVGSLWFWIVKPPFNKIDSSRNHAKIFQQGAHIRFIIESSINIIELHILKEHMLLWLVSLSEPRILKNLRNIYPLSPMKKKKSKCQLPGKTDPNIMDTRKTLLTCLGFGVNIRIISFLAPGENQAGHENSAL